MRDGFDFSSGLCSPSADLASPSVNQCSLGIGLPVVNYIENLAGTKDRDLRWST